VNYLIRKAGMPGERPTFYHHFDCVRARPATRKRRKLALPMDLSLAKRVLKQLVGLGYTDWYIVPQDYQPKRRRQRQRPKKETHENAKTERAAGAAAVEAGRR